MKTRREAAKELARDWRRQAKDWLDRLPDGDQREQTRKWALAAGTVAAVVGILMVPRATAALLAAAWIWKKIEERR